MNALLLNLALGAYLVATGLALAYLVHRREGLYRLGSLATLAGWVLHTLALVVRGVELARAPLATLPEAVSLLVWASVLLTLWAERQYGVNVLSAFVLPVVLSFSLSTIALPGGLGDLAPALRSAWIAVHAVLALLGISAFVLNFAGGIMYLLQERQLKSKRPGAFYYRLPSLETLDRITFRALTLGFPFLTAGLILGAVWAGAAWGSVFTFDPLALFSFVAWLIYAATLSGRVVAGWRGRRAAYFAVVGFAALLLTLGAGFFLPGRHGGS
ncbi:MAG: cytochrome c biogenesis protein CcsA [Candidatus Rokubacteria bacterium]|nr:cytochrome c biogenesis protein CcsA [Candidatus Rokubacteria bacterium]